MSGLDAHPAGTRIHRFGVTQAALTRSPDRRRDFADGAPAEALIEALREQLRRHEVRVLSLDVFDTLLLRDDTCEASRFLALSERQSEALRAAGHGEVSPLDLYVTRCEAMGFGYRFSREVAGCVEGRLPEILAAQARMLRLPDTAAILLEAEEMRHETEGLAPNRALLRLARGFAKSGGRVVCVSDMYLTTRQVDGLIDAVCGRPKLARTTWSSADTVLNKRSGRVFPWLADQLGVPPGRILHVGDSLEGDFQRPIAAGWRAFHLPIADAALRARERCLDGFRARMRSIGLNTDQWAKL